MGREVLPDLRFSPQKYQKSSRPSRVGTNEQQRKDRGLAMGFRNIVERSSSLNNELLTAIHQGRFGSYIERANGESLLYLFGERVGWDRNRVLEYCVEHQTMDFPQSRYENAFDSGWMEVQARTYHQALVIYKERTK